MSFLISAIEGFPNARHGKNTQYSLQDIVRSAFAVFFVQGPSFLAHQQLMQQAQGMNNGRTLFGIEKLPTDAQIRNLLDPVSPKHLRPVFDSCFGYFQQGDVLQQFRSFADTLLITLDATGYFHSESIHCPSCTEAHHRDGRMSYTHSALMPAIVKPGCPQLIPLEPEFIVPQDGHATQDCETKAATRWLNSIAGNYRSRGVTLLADDIYAWKPFIEEVFKQELQYIFVAKPTSHTYVYEELAAMEKLGHLKHAQRIYWTGKEHHPFCDRSINDVTLKNAENSIRVNWVELSITNAEGKPLFRNSFITSYLISDENVVELVEAGRCRWKIENKDFNTLKTKGCHFEHNFGHGKLYLSQTLLSPNILAFLFHTILELLEKRCTLLRKSLPRRDTFSQHVAALTQYLGFASWQSLLEFMIRGIRDGPIPPPDPSIIMV